MCKEEFAAFLEFVYASQIEPGKLHQMRGVAGDVFQGLPDLCDEMRADGRLGGCHKATGSEGSGALGLWTRDKEDRWGQLPSCKSSCGESCGESTSN